ncbi:MAG: efflux RND transporter periplasmic adaptor subunit [Elusimicrobiota bacterium]|nr:efflux RND transporter periplasmic adaptor subunit [Elusimicrobiota bacterium]
MNKKIALIAGLVVLGGAFTAYLIHTRGPESHAAHQIAGFQCPMHPAITSDKPGDCPICGMKLVPIEPAEAPSGAAMPTGKQMCVLHKCTMANCKMELPLKPGETVTCPVCGTHTAPPSPETGKILYYRNPMNPAVTSPVPMKDSMGMDYVPVYAEDVSETSVSGQATTVLSAQKRQLIGMKSEAISRRQIKFTVRASGSVAYDPELYNAIAEHHSAMVAREKVKDSPWPDVHERAEALVRASALRLRQLGLSEAQIGAYTGMEAAPTNLLLGGSDGSVWVYAQIYEYEISQVRPGQQAEITAPAYPGRIFHGTVKAVDPNLSAETRSLRVRIEVPNPDGLLKLEMYVNAAIKADLGVALALPEGALLDSGARKLVFVDLGEGRIEPREVRVGREADGYYELLSGVKAGEKVVTTANFLIDSESKLKSLVAPSKKKP